MATDRARTDAGGMSQRRVWLAYSALAVVAAVVVVTNVR
jgi:hypothetical protein